MTRWQVFGGRYDGYRIDTSFDDDHELAGHARILSPTTPITFNDIDNRGVSVTVTTTKEGTA